MSLFFYKSKDELPQAITNGNVYFVDDENIYVDSDDSRYSLNLTQRFSLADFQNYIDQMTNETPNEYSFAFVSDTHNYSDSATIVSKIESLGADVLVHAGDYVEYGSQSALASAVNSYNSDKYTQLVTRGNHDGTASSSYNTFLSESAVQAAMGEPYYYYDVPEAKLRFIVLNMEDRELPSVASDPQHYYGVGPTQMKWLCGDALQVSEPDWKAILVTHTPLAPLDTMIGWGNWNGGDYHENTSGIGRYYIANYVIGACNTAFNTGESVSLTAPYTEPTTNTSMNYTFNGNMEIIANLCGHVHYDNIYMVNGIPSISIEDNKYELPTDIVGGWDWVTINREEKTITLDKYDSSNVVIRTRTASWGAPTYDGVGSAEEETVIEEDNSGTTTPSETYDISCIVFNNGLLTYLVTDRATWNTSKIYEVDVSSSTVTLDLGTNTVTFTNGKAGIYTGVYRTVAVDDTLYYLHFNNGEYIGYSSNGSNMTEASDSSNDFFGVPRQDVTI